MTGFTAILFATAETTLHITVVAGDDIINGGKKASKNSLQYMVSVQNNKPHLCGGFLIYPQYVLTAAHCASLQKVFQSLHITQIARLMADGVF
ncbi:granzyme M-like [Carassius auratus]|uniref:Granzyme M-like n=1 Tax=Carassius auratus TaxID=7957 RepID=A0A6P6J206_CARAU|nr:granzyme M-like [Carassius auratus]